MAYFSDAGVPIHSGAAGLGQDSGALMSFRDGSLGLPQTGPLRSFRDGSLGQDSGALMSFRDGSLGLPLYIDGKLVRGPVNITHGTAGCRSCGGVGALFGRSASFNAADPATLLELKKLMAVIAQIHAPGTLGPAMPADFLTRSSWSEADKNFAGQWIVTIGSIAPGTEVGSFFDEGTLMPNANGAIGMLTLIGYPNLESAPIEPTPPPTTEEFPILTTYYDQEVLGEEPGLSRLAMFGLGAAALVGVAMLLMPRKRRR